MANLHSLFTASMIFLKYSGPKTEVEISDSWIFCHTVPPEKMDEADTLDLNKAGWFWDGFVCAWALST